MKSYKLFLRALREASAEYPFELISNGIMLRDGVEAYSLLHQRPSGALFGPLAVVHYHLIDAGYWIGHEPSAGKALELSSKKVREIHLASTERKGHLLELRQRLLRAAHVKEVPHKKRLPKERNLAS